jgi:hypothetical protein
VTILDDGDWEVDEAMRRRSSANWRSPTLQFSHTRAGTPRTTIVAPPRSRVTVAVPGRVAPCRQITHVMAFGPDRVRRPSRQGVGDRLPALDDLATSAAATLEHPSHRMNTEHEPGVLRH